MQSKSAHAFDEVLAYLRDVRRAGGLYGTIELTFRGPEIVYVRTERGFQPGELPLSPVNTVVT